MRKTPLKVFALTAVLSFVGAVAAAAHKTSDRPSDKKILEEFTGYRGWTRVTAEPVQVPLDAASVGG